jgi:hypothetical protein
MHQTGKHNGVIVINLAAGEWNSQFQHFLRWRLTREGLYDKKRWPLHQPAWQS